MSEVSSLKPIAMPAGMQPIKTAPKYRPILAWCDHEIDPYVADEQTGRLTLYAAHAEGLSHAPTGFHIIEWGGSYNDGTWEYPSQSYLSDWWFVKESDFEKAANPIYWMDLPVVPGFW